MALNPELKAMISSAHAKYADDPLATKWAEILARQAEAHREYDRLVEMGAFDKGSVPSIRAQLAKLGFDKATKRELQKIVLNAMERDDEA